MQFRTITSHQEFAVLYRILPATGICIERKMTKRDQTRPKFEFSGKVMVRLQAVDCRREARTDRNPGAGSREGFLTFFIGLDCREITCGYLKLPKMKFPSKSAYMGDTDSSPERTHPLASGDANPRIHGGCFGV